MNPAPRVPDFCAEPTLADVLKVIEAHLDLASTRQRDLRSAVKRVAGLLGQDPGRITLDMPSISSRLAAISPVGAGLSPKRWFNLRSDFLAAVKASGLKPIAPKVSALTSGWTDLLGRVPGKRAALGLSRFARFGSANGIEPADVDDAAIERFIVAVREGSLHRKPQTLHRSVALIWNEVASLPGFVLKPVTVPSFRSPLRRVDWNLLAASFREDVERYLDWCSGSDPFDLAARRRPLAPQTVRLLRDQIHTAVTALVDSGAELAAVASLAMLVSPDSMKSILRQRFRIKSGGPNSFNQNLGAVLVRIAKEWIKADDAVLAELRSLASKMPAPASGLTDKNKRFLRQFDDPAVWQRLFELPKRLWAEVKSDSSPNFLTLAKAQVALAVGLLLYIPLRIQNLTALAFDKHLFLRDRVRAVSSLELDASEVKNRTPLAFDIPPHLAQWLIDYRDRIAPGIIGRRSERLFVNVDGSAKTPTAVSDLITRYVNKRAGIELTPHQFRHLSAKFLLDAEPGSFETVKQLLGHQSLKTTVAAYAGIDSRRAARHHHRLIERMLATQPFDRRRPQGGNRT